MTNKEHDDAYLTAMYSSSKIVKEPKIVKELRIQNTLQAIIKLHDMGTITDKACSDFLLETAKSYGITIEDSDLT